jgi:LysM repeat protein
MEAWVTSEASVPKGASMKPARKSRRRRPWVVAASIVGSLVMLPVVFVLSAYIYLQAAGLIFPGVRVGGRLLQGMTMQQASAELERLWNQEHRILAIDYADTTRSWIVAPDEFGLSVDAQSSAAVAYAHGRQGGLLAGITQMFDGWIYGLEIRPWVFYDPVAARLGLEAWVAEVNVAPVEADLWLEDGKTVQVTGQAGKALDVEASLAMLASDPSAVLLDFQFMLLITNPVAPAIWDLSATAAEAEGMLGSPLAIRAYDPVTDEHFAWAPTRAEIASWLRIERTEHEMRVILDAERLRAYVAGLEASLGDERTFDLEEAVAAAKIGLEGGEADTLLIHYLPRRYVVQRGDTLISISMQVGIPYWKIQAANPGLARQGISVGRELTIPPRDAMLPLPVVMNKRIVISISQQHMWIYQDGELLRDHVVSTGMSSSPTMPGIFQVQERYINAYASRWDLWMPHFLGIYRATPGLLNGIHGLPLLSSGVRLWGSVLGRPASYGCIILDLNAAEQLYEWAENGVVVEIRR